MHVIANCMKTFLRQMPDTLLTIERYDHFLSAAGVYAEGVFSMPLTD